jgi:hypothetical protein
MISCTARSTLVTSWTFSAPLATAMLKTVQMISALRRALSGEDAESPSREKVRCLVSRPAGMLWGRVSPKAGVVLELRLPPMGVAE